MSVSKGLLVLAMFTFVMIAGLWFIRRSRLYEKYALMWIAIALAGATFLLFPEMPKQLGAFLGFALPSNFVLVLGLLILLLLTFSLTADVTRLRKQVEVLAINQAVSEKRNSDKD
jgi:hypothetical protein